MSKIPWTDKSLNVVTGCTECSPGCAACYARTMHRRLRAMGQPKYDHDWGEVRTHPECLDIPLKRRNPTTYFVNSMGDTFHPDVPDAFVCKLWARFARCPQHRFIVLTKRAERMHDVLRSQIFQWTLEQLSITSDWPLPNVVLMVTCCNQQEAVRNIPLLLDTPAACRGVSLEPLLGPMNLRTGIYQQPEDRGGASFGTSLEGIDWVIAGCESGPKRRISERHWFQSLRDDCVSAGVPFFLKQLGVNGKVVSMPKLDGKQWAQRPKMLEVG